LQQESVEGTSPVLPTLPAPGQNTGAVRLQQVQYWPDPHSSEPSSPQLETAEKPRQDFVNTLPEAYACANVMHALSSDVGELRDAAVHSAQDLQTTLARIRDMKQKVDDTMALLIRETRAAKLRRRRRVTMAVGLGLLVLYLVFSSHGQFYHFWWIFNFGGGVWAADQMAGARRDAATALRDAGDPRAVGVLAIAARDGDPRVRIAAVDALRRLMPRLRASDAGYIQRRSDGGAHTTGIWRADERAGSAAAGLEAGWR
jgi:hypothetical protein